MILQRKEFNFLPGEREAGERRSLNLLSRAIFHARENLNKIIYYRERNLLCVDIFKRKIEKFLTEFPKLWEFNRVRSIFFFLFIFSQINRKRGGCQVSIYDVETRKIFTQIYRLVFLFIFDATLWHDPWYLIVLLNIFSNLVVLHLLLNTIEETFG